MPDAHVVVKIDFRNAFNSLRRDLMLRSVVSTVPGIYRFCHLCYNQPSVLRFENRILLSQDGPLLFCISMHPDLLRLQPELVAGFMDDLTLGGPTDKVAADVDYIRDRQQAPAYGASLRSPKLYVEGPLLGQYSSTSSSLWHLTRQIFWVPHFSQAKRWTQLWPTAALSSTPPSDVCLCCQPMMHLFCSKHHSAHPK